MAEMSGAQTLTVTYGRDHTRADCYVLPAQGGYWYAIHGSRNVNFTQEELTPGCDVEKLHDSDTFTWPDGVHSEDELERAVNA